MSVNPKRLRALPLAVLVAAAVPLAVPGAANAAMGGAIPGTTTLRPDLRSATVTNVSATDVTTVRFCFNKTIGSTPDHNQLIVGGYGRTFGPTEIPANSATRVASAQNCADAVYSAVDVDSTQRTYGRANAGAVVNLANGDPNHSDSTALIGSTTNNGTRDHGVGADLEGVTVNVGANTVNYIFDQRVNDASTTPGDFWIVDLGGNTTPNVGGAGGVTITGNVVTVLFPAGTVGSAVNASVDDFAIEEKTQFFNTEGTMSAAVPGNSGLTDDPDLQTVTVNHAGTSVDFVFDETIVAGPDFAAAGTFNVYGADELVILSGTAPTIVNGNTVRLDLNGSQVNEYLIRAEVLADAVTSDTTGNENDEFGVATGANAGAFALGFTVAPEALRVTFDVATSTASVVLDQRFFSFNAGQINLIDDTGAELPFTPIAVAGAGGPVGQVTSQVVFSPGELTGARSIQFNNGAFSTSAAAFSHPNVPQIVSPTATAKVVRKAGKVVRTKARGAKRKNAAQLRASKRAMKRIAR